ncbi:retron Ec48 family effector membrane protein [Aeromonas sp. CU5]|uniref:retron Ec48 family effector membrane protein n=1 Tax=Aeromonas sp. CU5 TaxID=2033033 RepID=UPI0012FE3907|nr:retron Ec48 family effector membrane protein [Aeromonas sp. CU5]
MTKINMKNFIFFILVIAGVVTVCFLFSLAAIIVNDLYYKSFCFSSECYAFAFKKIEPATQILLAGGWFLTLFGTLGGALIALTSYLTSIKHNAFNNHLSHIRLFSDFVNTELTKHSGISKNKIDVFHWYNSIFPDSSNGNMEVSKDYYKNIDYIALEVLTSNNTIIEKANIYIMDHQKRVLPKIEAVFGTQIDVLPKNDYIKVESEIFMFIDKVNKTFTNSSVSLSSQKRLYT